MAAGPLGCGLRRAELATVTAGDLQRREEHWVFADLIGKGSHVRTVPIPHCVGAAIQAWLTDAGVAAGPVFRAINKAGRIASNGFSPEVIWSVATTTCRQCGLAGITPHDLRRTCARLCHGAGGEMEQIQFLPGHDGVQTTERSIGCKRRLRNAVNRRICLGLRPRGLPPLEATAPSRSRLGNAVCEHTEADGRASSTRGQFVHVTCGVPSTGCPDNQIELIQGKSCGVHLK